MQEDTILSNKNERGFAAMDREKQRRIASKGGKAAHEKGTAHEFTPEEARVAGRKGGEVVSRNRAHMAEIGRRGAEARSSRYGHNTLRNRQESAPEAAPTSTPASGTES
jgi:general stress protein YciG